MSRKPGGIETSSAEELDAGTTPAVLASFRAEGRFRDAGHESLMKAVLLWLAAHRVPSSPARWSNIGFISSAFVLFCSPPGAPRRHLELAARFVALIFLIDDAETPDLVEHRRFLEAGARASQTPTAPTALGRIYEDLVAELCALGPPPRLFAACWLRTCRAMEEERTGAWQTGTLRELCALRQDSIVAHAYAQLWYAMNGLQPGDEELEQTDRLRHLAVEQIMLCNDLGSADKDARRETAEPNYVLRLRQEASLPSLEAAVAMVVERYNRQIDELEHSRREVLARAPGERMAKLVALTLMSVNGNLDATRYLVRFRYSDHRLDQLARLSP